MATQTAAQKKAAAAAAKKKAAAAAKKAAEQNGGGGFWDTYVDEGGSGYVTADEKAALIDNEVAFQITDVREDDDNLYEGKSNPRFVTTVLLPNSLTGEEEERIIGFAKIPGGSSRDRALEGMMEYIDAGGEDVFVKLGKKGNFVTIEAA